jgi:hypothetical protein
VLTVSKKETGGGKYRSIGAALAAVKPGMTVRVLDGETYREQLLIRGQSRFRGVTLEAQNKATIQGSGTPEDKTEIVVTLSDVSGFTLRGFRLRSGETARSLLIDVAGQVPGVTLEGLDLESAYTGVEIRNVALQPEELPVVVRNSTVRARRGVGVAVVGDVPAQPPRALESGHVIVSDNRFLDTPQATVLSGTLRRVVVAGNVYVGSTLSAVDLLQQLTGAQDLLIANNTMVECRVAFRVWDSGVKGKNIQFRNNLLLGPYPQLDLAFLDNGGVPLAEKGPGDVGRLRKDPNWRFGHNWREIKEPAADNPLKPYWIPAAATDRLEEPIAVLSREVGRTDFLRPAKNSPLATSGAGGDLPSHVGAVQRKGSPPGTGTGRGKPGCEGARSEALRAGRKSGCAAFSFAPAAFRTGGSSAEDPPAAVRLPADLPLRRRRRDPRPGQTHPARRAAAPR